jgi:hypothetical protein
MMNNKVPDIKKHPYYYEALLWWDKCGSDFFKWRQFSAATTIQQKNLDAKNPHSNNYIGGESGIFLGKPWAKLNYIEKCNIIYVYMKEKKNFLNAKSDTNN